MNSIKVRLFEPAPLLHIGTLSIQILTDIPDDRSNGSKLLLLLLLGCIIRPTAKAGATNTAWEQEGKRTEEEGWETRCGGTDEANWRRNTERGRRKK